MFKIYHEIYRVSQTVFISVIQFTCTTPPIKESHDWYTHITQHNPTRSAIDSSYHSTPPRLLAHLLEVHNATGTSNIYESCEQYYRSVGNGCKALCPPTSQNRCLGQGRQRLAPQAHQLRNRLLSDVGTRPMLNRAAAQALVGLLLALPAARAGANNWGGTKADGRVASSASLLFNRNSICSSLADFPFSSAALLHRGARNQTTCIYNSIVSRYSVGQPPACCCRL